MKTGVTIVLLAFAGACTSDVSPLDASQAVDSGVVDSEVADIGIEESCPSVKPQLRMRIFDRIEPQQCLTALAQVIILDGPRKGEIGERFDCDCDCMFNVPFGTQISLSAVVDGYASQGRPIAVPENCAWRGTADFPMTVAD